MLKRKMLQLGSSQHWSKTLQSFTGEETISVDALFEYFEPLYEWLKKENNKHPLNTPGW
jgi:peptidyl-dipeptidase A